MRLTTQFISILWVLLVSSSSFALTVNAQVDTHKVQQGDSLILTVTVNERAFGKEPDFSPLKEHFDIINKVNSSNVKMINGQMESSLSWRLTLVPKIIGYVVIPPINYGKQQTKAITIQVTKRSASSKPKAKDLVFIEATIDKKSVYVQEQLVLTLRLYKRTQLIDPAWTPPAINDAVMERLTDARTYQTNIGGYTYHVNENTFAIFPQKSGTLVIPESTLIGTIGTGRRGGFFLDPFSSSGKQIRRTTQRLDIEVKPIPNSYPKTHWLPSSSVAIADHWSPDKPEFKVGEAVTRTITLQAKGLTATALPTIPTPQGSKFKVYPDKADTLSDVDADGIISQRVESYAFIPTEAGKVVLPEIQVSWWDVTRDQIQTATLPSQTILVKGAATTHRTDQTISAPPSLSATSNAAPPSLNGESPSSENTTWQWLALISTSLWVLTVIVLIWVATRKRAPQAKHQTTDPQAALLRLKDAKKQLKQACQNDDPEQIKTRLIEWGKAMFPDQTCISLGDLRKLIQEEKCRSAIKELEILLYKHGDNKHFDGAYLWEAIEEVTKHAAQQSHEPALAPLYPTA